MAQAVAGPHRQGFLATLRNDRWWLEPGLVAIGLTLFFGYLTVSALLDGWAFENSAYLSPVYEPKLHGEFSVWWFSPALLILWGPAGFRATCYYYRRAYYRSYLLSPPACAVADALPGGYSGESKFPLIIQNLHRFFMYVALVFIPLLWFGAVEGFHDEHDGWGIGLGSLILCFNAFFLMMYTFSCHSFRHFIGGSINQFSSTGRTKFRYKLWSYVSTWNERHRLWAWTSLIWILFTDIYIRLVANEHITDLNTWDSF